MSHECYYSVFYFADLPHRHPSDDMRHSRLLAGNAPESCRNISAHGEDVIEHKKVFSYLGSNSPQTVSLETDCAESSLQLCRDARSAAQRKENEKKGCSPCRQTSVRLHLCPLPQELSFPHRTGQPHPTLYQNKHLERNSIVFRDWRMPIAFTLFIFTYPPSGPIVCPFTSVSQTHRPYANNTTFFSPDSTFDTVA